MSFRKRNVGLISPSNPSFLPTSSSRSSSNLISPALASGIRPSPVDGRITTSTGTQSLDDLLAGHAGLALGTSILIGERGVTDYAGTLLRYYAAEGILQGHKVVAIGLSEQWGRELPNSLGSTNSALEDASKSIDKEKMKIAWRYENLGDFGSKPSNSRAPQLPNRNLQESTRSDLPLTGSAIFCHSFDLTKRLTVPPSNPILYLPVPSTDHTKSPFSAIINSLTQQLNASPNKIHRLVIPSLLSPGFYPPHASNPSHILQFLHSLRGMLHRYSTQLTAMISLPLTLYPRSTGLVRWMEILSDGVFELAPFPHAIETGLSTTTSAATAVQEETPQGMVKIHRLPILHEKGGGGEGNGELSNDFAFTVSRRRFAIKPFSLPPVDGDTEAQSGADGAKATKVEIDF